MFQHLWTFKLFPPFPKNISQHFSAFSFSIWGKHCYTEIKRFASNALMQACALLNVCVRGDAYLLHQGATKMVGSLQDWDSGQSFTMGKPWCSLDFGYIGPSEL